MAEQISVQEINKERSKQMRYICTAKASLLNYTSSCSLPSLRPSKLSLPLSKVLSSLREAGLNVLSLTGVDDTAVFDDTAVCCDEAMFENTVRRDR